MLARTQTPIKDALNGAAGDVASWAEQVGAPLGSRNPLNARAHEPAPKYITAGQAHNIVQSNLFDAVSAGSVALRTNAAVDGDITALIAIIEQFAQEVQANAAYGPATTYLQSIASQLQHDPDAFLEIALAETIGTLASLAAAGLEAA